MIRFRGVHYRYDDRTPVIEGADVEILPGLTLLLGPNGTGKSTFLRLASGVEAPDAGSIEVAGHDLWRDEVEARRVLAYVPEQPDLSPYATLAEILRLVCRLRGVPAERGEELLEVVGLAALRNRTAREVSLGQRRRALVAAAMVGSARALLLDDPLEAMDRPMRERILAWIDRARASGAAVIVATHEIEPFLPSTTAAVTLGGGRTIAATPPAGPPEARLAFFERLARGDSDGAG